jgi:hypothetical protein
LLRIWSGRAFFADGILLSNQPPLKLHDGEEGFVYKE